MSKKDLEDVSGRFEFSNIGKKLFKDYVGRAKDLSKARNQAFADKVVAGHMMSIHSPGTAGDEAYKRFGDAVTRHYNAQKDLEEHLTRRPARNLALGVGGTAALLGLGYGAKKYMDYRKKKNQQKTVTAGVRIGYAPTYIAFKDEMSKIAYLSEPVGHALELGGLGILAAPSVASAVGRPMSPGAAHAAELAGLGTLAVHPTLSLVKHLREKKREEEQQGAPLEKLSASQSALWLFKSAQAKEAGILDFLKRNTKPVAEQAQKFVPSFQGHGATLKKALNLGTAVTGTVKDTASWDPLAQTKTRALELVQPGLRRR